MAFQTTIEIFRHEERMDCVEDEKEYVDIPHDTPLSCAGCAKAIASANDVEPANLTISSPLKRCVQTAKPFLKGNVLIVDARFMEVFHPKVVGPLANFTLRSDEELHVPFLIRTRHDIPVEESRGIGGTADQRYRAAIIDVAQKAQSAGIKHVRIFTHGDCLGSFASMFRKSIYQVDFGASMSATYDGTWTYIGGIGIGIMDD